MSKYFTTIRSRLIGLCLLVLLPALGIMLYSGYERRNNDIKIAEERVLVLTRSIAGQQSEITNGIRQTLRSLAQMPEIQRLDRVPCTAILKKIHKQNTFYSVVFLALPDGTRYASSIPLPAANYNDRKYFLDALRTKDFSVGEYVIGRTMKLPLIHFSYPVLDRNGRVTAVLVIGFTLDQYVDTLPAELIKEGFVIGITDHKGIRLFRYPDTQSTVTGVGAPTAGDSLKAAVGKTLEGNYVTVGSDGTRRLYAFRQLRLKENAPPYMTVIAGISVDKALASANRSMMKSMALLLAAMVASLLLALFFGNVIIAAKIKSLVATAQRFGRGDLGARTDVDYNEGELGLLAKSFDEMAHSLAADIEARTKAEDALREREEVFRLLFEKSGDSNLLLDEGRFIDCNEAACRMIGCSGKDALLHLKPEDISPERQPDGTLSSDKVRQLIDGAYREGSSRFEWVHRRLDGTELYLDVLLTRIVIGGKEILYTTWRDITERKKAEDELRDSQQRLMQIIEFLPDATLVIDREGRVIAWNRAIESMTGIKAAEMIGKGDYEYSLPFYGERRPILIDLALLPDREREKQYTAIQRIGDVLFGESFTPALPPGDVHLSATATVLRDSKGEIIAAIECIRDNTIRRRLEERLNRAEKMEGLGRMAGGVAHDLNNVLGVLVGYAELLGEKLPQDSPLRKYAENILQSSVRGAAIIQDLLTLARRGVTISEVLDLNRVIFDYLKSPEFEKLKSYHPGVKIWAELEEGLLFIKGSSVHLGKALMNLVSNAAEAIADHGEVTIRTENCYLDKPIGGYDEVKEGDYAVLKVSDTGSGISSQDIGKIFEPFYTKKSMGRSGTGLGLAVVWGTVKDHQGYIDIWSEEEKGSTFTLYFPVTREDISKDRDTTSLASCPGRGEHILVVDDVTEQRELALSMLERLGYQATAVPSGEEAISYLRQHQVDLVVLDMIMDSGMDGLETYENILAIRPRQKAVVVSGFSETDRVKRMQELGAGAFVRKPYLLEQIGTVIRKELDRQE
jgi:two-component system cell cycle sensor histidine kinase/response regulator CckA